MRRGVVSTTGLRARTPGSIFVPVPDGVCPPTTRASPPDAGRLESWRSARTRRSPSMMGSPSLSWTFSTTANGPTTPTANRGTTTKDKRAPSLQSTLRACNRSPGNRPREPPVCAHAVQAVVGAPSFVLKMYLSASPSPGAVEAMALDQNVMLRIFFPHTTPVVWCALT